MRRRERTEILIQGSEDIAKEFAKQAERIGGRSCSKSSFHLRSLISFRGLSCALKSILQWRSQWAQRQEQEESASICSWQVDFTLT